VSKRLSFSIDSYKVLEDDPYITILELFIVSEGDNRHETYFDLESIKDAIPSLPNKPILAIYDNYNNDVREHARNKFDIEQRDCVGNIPESLNAEIVEYKDKQFLKCRACVWKHYFPKIAELLKNNQDTKISMEIEVLESYKDNKDGFLHITKFRFMGISLLGQKYLEAIPNATAKIIKYSTSDYNEIVADTNKKLMTFSIPNSIKENAKKALNLKQKNPQLISFSKEIINNEKLSFSKINLILNKIQNLKKEDNLMFFGGVESKEWCENIVNQFNIKIKNEKEKEGDLMLKETIEKVFVKFGLNSAQIREILNSALSKYKYSDSDWTKYWVEAYDEDFVYVCDCEESNTKRMKYTIVDNVANVDIESAEVVISAGYMPIGASAGIDINSVGDNENETVDIDDYKAKFEEMSTKFDEMCKKYSDLEKESNEKYAQIEELKKFKADTEKKDMESKANELYSKYNDYISDEEKTDLNIKLFSVDSFETFKEKVFAIVIPKMEAENLALKQNKNNNGDSNINTIQYSTMPLLENVIKNERKSSLDKLKEYVNS
jgi:hypothetical protein